MRPSFWHERWRDGQIGFHRDQANPALTTWWKDISPLDEGTVLVPLCGKSLDLHWLSENQSHVTGVDISGVAIEQFWAEAGLPPARSREGDYRKTSSPQISLLEGSFFTVQSEQIGQVSSFYDRAALIALPAELRAHHAAALARLTSPGTEGLLVTVEYDQSEIDGPPFSVPPAAVERLLGDHFTVEALASADAFERASKLTERGLTALTEHIIKLTRR